MKNLGKKLLSLVAVLLSAVLMAGCLEEGARLEFVKFPDAVYMESSSKGALPLAEIQIKINEQVYSVADAKNLEGVTVTGDTWPANWVGRMNLVITYYSTTISFGYEVVKSVEPSVDKLDFNISGTGTEEDPFLISSEAELRALAAIVNHKVPADKKAEVEEKFTDDNFTGQFVKQTANIRLHGGWEPIGEGYRYQNYYTVKDGKVTTTPDENLKYFSGTYDGGNYTISDLTNTGYNPENAAKKYHNSGKELIDEGYVFGLFGLIYGATIQNVQIENVQIEENLLVVGQSAKRYVSDSVGAIAGYTLSHDESKNHMPNAKENLIANCKVLSGNINGYDAVGGIIGRIYQKITVKDCSNAANVFGRKKCGGLSGIVSIEAESNGSQFINFTNSGRIICDRYDYVAACVAHMAVTDVVISGCVNTGEVYGNQGLQNPFVRTNRLVYFTEAGALNVAKSGNNKTIEGFKLSNATDDRESQLAQKLS